MDNLSRLLITGDINENTPLCVLIEIAEAHGISYDQNDIEDEIFAHYLIHAICKTTIISIKSPMNPEDLKYVARFVNKNTSWSKNKLMESYIFLKKFMEGSSDTIKFEIPSDFKFGLQTPETPNSLNACVLCKICYNNKINLYRKTKIEQMANVVKLFHVDMKNLISKSVDFIEKSADRIDLLNLLIKKEMP